MKTVAFQRTPGATFVQPLQLDLIADSALVMPDKPIFLPDFTDKWSMVVYVAYRISRLGKGIAPKFASRYYDAVTVAVRLLPAHLLDMLYRGYSPTGVGGVFDNCLALGKWLPLPADPSTPLAVIAQDIDYQLTPSMIDVDNAVSLLSQISTLKTGDIVMPCHLPMAIAPSAGMELNFSLQGSPVLPLRIR